MNEDQIKTLIRNDPLILEMIKTIKSYIKKYQELNVRISKLEAITQESK